MAAIAAFVLAGMACVQQPLASENQKGSDDMIQCSHLINVTSPAFADNGRIPVIYTADGDDMSPPLNWKGAPAGVVEYAVICEDPDAPGGTFTHWVIYGLPGSYDGIGEGVEQISELDNGAMQGVNSFGKIGYGGPSPPKGPPHHYIFTVYALSAKLDLPAGISKDDLRKAIQGYVLMDGKITGLYGR